jgi:hypothetical protein
MAQIGAVRRAGHLFARSSNSRSLIIEEYSLATEVVATQTKSASQTGGVNSAKAGLIPSPAKPGDAQAEALPSL